ncbi:MAG TPA: OmpH family outer membrane protein [Spongiibacteraceae bacterium]|nr:OmpH family outer membrane protein [Spongiibacteraceae bacterium]
MVKLYKVVMLMGVLLASSLAGAQATVQGKIAVLDPQLAIISTDEAQKRLKSLDAQPDFDANKKSLDKMKKEYEDMVKTLQKDVATLSAEQKEAQGKKLEGKRSDMEFVARKLQGSQQDLLQKLMQEMEPKFKKVVSDLIKSENIGLLLDARAVMHVDNSFNITSKVTEQLNKGN